MKLYYSSGACSLSPHIALLEAGLKFTLEAVNLQDGTYKGAEYSKVVAKGYVPALELDNGELLTEGAVIVQYIADLVPQKKLAPAAGTMERYRLQEWLNFIATEVHKGFSPLWNDKLPDEVKALARAELSKKCDLLSQALQGKTFLMGTQYTVADGYLFTVLNWAQWVKFDLTKWPTLLGFMETVKNRPATREALKAEELD